MAAKYRLQGIDDDVVGQAHKAAETTQIPTTRGSRRVREVALLRPCRAAPRLTHRLQTVFFGGRSLRICRALAPPDVLLKGRMAGREGKVEGTERGEGRRVGGRVSQGLSETGDRPGLLGPLNRLVKTSVDLGFGVEGGKSRGESVKLL